MSLGLYLTNLKERHVEIENEIKHEMARPLPDFILITKLKKKKLKIKEMIKLVLNRMNSQRASSA
jgi:hypothetical protein